MFSASFINLLQKEEIPVGFRLLLKTEIAKIEAEQQAHAKAERRDSVLVLPPHSRTQDPGTPLHQSPQTIQNGQNGFSRQNRGFPLCTRKISARIAFNLAIKSIQFCPKSKIPNCQDKHSTFLDPKTVFRKESTSRSRSTENDTKYVENRTVAMATSMAPVVVA